VWLQQTANLPTQSPITARADSGHEPPLLTGTLRSIRSAASVTIRPISSAAAYTRPERCHQHARSGAYAVSGARANNLCRMIIDAAIRRGLEEPAVDP
jgi:hypothetical protein